jgi:hypothetical protein
MRPSLTLMLHSHLLICLPPAIVKMVFFSYLDYMAKHCWRQGTLFSHNCGCLILRLQHGIALGIGAEELAKQVLRLETFI